jgi:hypothetical protein
MRRDRQHDGCLVLLVGGKFLNNSQHCTTAAATGLGDWAVAAGKPMSGLRATAEGGMRVWASLGQGPMSLGRLYSTAKSWANGNGKCACGDEEVVKLLGI